MDSTTKLDLEAGFKHFLCAKHGLTTTFKHTLRRDGTAMCVMGCGLYAVPYFDPRGDGTGAQDEVKWEGKHTPIDLDECVCGCNAYDHCIRKDCPHHEAGH